MASDEQDFRTAFGNFRFRWDQRLRDAGVHTEWHVDVPDTVLAVPPHDALQLLRILQEALTNVIKHAQAKRVQVSLRHDANGLTLEVQDDGIGLSSNPGSQGGRGLANMRSRAGKLGARLSHGCTAHGTRVALVWALSSADTLAAVGDHPTAVAPAGTAAAS